MKTKIIIAVIYIVSCLGCTKDFLEKKSDDALLVPKTLADLQMLLDNMSVNNASPGLFHIAADDFYMEADALQYYTKTEKGAYIWQKDLYESGFSGDWNAMFKQIFYANIVLKQLEGIKISSFNTFQYNEIKGAALFYRGWAYFHLAQEFVTPYDKLQAKNLTGLPIKTNPDVNDKPPFGSMKDLYDQIILDLNKASDLLNTENNYKNRPSRQAVFGLMARLYLTMGDYEAAEKSCNAYLNINHKLVDFNDLVPTAARPLPSVIINNNVEGIFYAEVLSYAFLSSPLLMVDPELYKSYRDYDLRKTCYIRSRGNQVYTFKGSYTGTSTIFTGIATDEVLLTRAECRVRMGLIGSGMQDLNMLLENRIDRNFYQPVIITDQKPALLLILEERRKELISRGTRWFDLRRLNKESEFEVTITRNLNHIIYTLKPNDPGYIFPIPGQENSLTN